MDHPQRVTARSRFALRSRGWTRALLAAFRARPLVWGGAAILAGLAIAASLWLILMVTAAFAVRSDVASLKALQEQSLSLVSPSELSDASTQLQSLRANLRRIDRLTALPIGESIVGKIPWLGPRYVASRSILDIGVKLSDAGAVGSSVAAQSLTAFQTSGFNATTPAADVTWLDVVARNSQALDRVQADLALAASERAGLDEAALPGPVQARMHLLDDALTRYQQTGASDNTRLSALLNGLGSQKTVRYLILFQNPAELRPSGGFPGTMGLVTIDRGQLVSYQIFDGHTLTDAYIAQRRSKRSEPWPIDHFFPQDGFLLHDAGWYADFPRAGATIMSMYAETNWPPIDGVIAIQPSVVADLLQVTGPLDVVIDGETRHITPDNVYDEIERQRRLIVEGIKPWDKTREVHKEAVAEIGEAIVARLKTADRGQMVDAAKLLMKSADARDIQIYAADPALESVVDRHGWTGKLDPDQNDPAVAITFANVALQKTSEFMHPMLDFSLSAPENGRQTVTLKITVDNTGPLGEDPLYSGFQKWWIQVALPPGFTRISSSAQPEPDPEAPNGGSYLAGTNPQESNSVRVVFSMPINSHFLLRRQPGLTTAQVTLSEPSCGASAQLSLTRDEPVDASRLCQP